MEFILDAVKDTLVILPFLYLVYLFSEFIEHHMSSTIQSVITKSKRFGPLIGSILGVFPQCGFSAMASTLYTARIITIGTLISIYLATSDEMLAILISSRAPLNLIIQILLIKIIVGFISGFVIDLIYHKNYSAKKAIQHMCNDDDCGCAENIWLSALRHTAKVAIYIFATTLVINYLFDLLNITAFLADTNSSLVIATIVGLIPNCASSIVITELYLEGSLHFGAMMAGLLANTGVGLLVLYRTNHHFKENVYITLGICGIAYISGWLITLLNI